jgi:hypothetical protein
VAGQQRAVRTRTSVLQVVHRAGCLAAGKYQHDVLTRGSSVTTATKQRANIRARVRSESVVGGVRAFVGGAPRRQFISTPLRCVRHAPTAERAPRRSSRRTVATNNAMGQQTHGRQASPGPRRAASAMMQVRRW